MAREFLRELGFKKSEDIEKVLSIYPVNHLTDETLVKRIKDFYEFFKLKGYANYEIKRVIYQCPSILGYDVATIANKIDVDYKGLGYNDIQIKKMIKSNAKVTGYDVNRFFDVIEHLACYGFSKEQVLELIVFSPSIVGEDMNLITDKLNNLLDFGFEKSGVVKLVTKVPTILTYAIVAVNNKLNFFINLGFSKDDVCKMALSHPQLLSYNTGVNKRKFNMLLDEGFTYDEVLVIFRNMPGFFSGDFNRHLEKIRFLRDVGLENVIFEAPKNLIQGVEVTYAKYSYLKSIGEEISSVCYRKIFFGNERFLQKFGKTKEELLEMYSYDDYVKERETKNGNTI